MLKNKSLFLATIVFVASAWSHTGQVAKASDASSTATNHGAIETFTAAITKDPKDTEAYLNRARAYEMAMQYQRALDDYDKIIEIDPQNSDAYEKRGSLYLCALKEPQKSLADFNIAISLDSANDDAFVGRGDALNDLGRYEEAIRDFNRAIDLNPKSDAAYLYRKDSYEHLGKTQLAQKDWLRTQILMGAQYSAERCTAGISADPDNIGLYYLRAKLFSDTKQYRSALDDLTKVISLKPDSTEAYFRRGMIWRELGNPKNAITDYTIAIKLDPSGAQARHWEVNFSDHKSRGLVYKARGDAYIEHCQKNCANNYYVGNEAQLHENMYTAAQCMQAFRPGSTGYQTGLNLQAQTSEIFQNVQKAKQIDDLALQDYSTAISLDSKDAGAYEKRANAYRETHDYYKAITDYDSAMALDSEIPIDVANLHFQRASCYRELQQYAKAIADYTAIIDWAIDVVPKQSAPDKELSNEARSAIDNLYKTDVFFLSTAYYQRGAIYRRLKQRSNAQADFDHATSLDPQIAQRIALDNKLERTAK